MKWVGITGTWRVASKQVENDVRQEVSNIIRVGNGIVSGGALNVDYFATDEAMQLNPDFSQIKIFLPSTLDVFARHYRKRADEGVITHAQAEQLITQLKRIKDINPASLIENTNHIVINKTAYFERNQDVINASDELLAFHVNKSEGVQDTINKAKKKNIPIRVFEYKI